MTDDLDLRAQARIGHVLNDKWRLERLLGVGGMAAVYAARHRNGAKAAVKVLHSELGADPDVRQRFLHEGYAANKVEHPNAVQVLDDDQVTSGAPGDAGTAYLVMELLEGESLLEYARRQGKALEEREVLNIAEQVLDVLEAAHAHGIVHRDLKPENLFLVKSAIPTSRADSFPAAGLAAMLAPPMRVKVLDFGIARIADGDGRTRVGIALGTPTYMAPEQASGRRDEIDGRTDLFALGATLWRLLTGKRIHDAPSSAEILAMMATRPAPPILTIAPRLSPSLALIIDHALQFRREDRYPDARAMREDVCAVLEGRPPLHATAQAAFNEMPTAVDRPIASFAPLGMELTGLPPVEQQRTAIVDNLSAPRVALETAPGSSEIPPTHVYPPIATAQSPTAVAPASTPRRSPSRRFVVLALVSLVFLIGIGVGGAWLFTGTKSGDNASGAKSSDDDPPNEPSDESSQGEGDDQGKAKKKHAGASKPKAAIEAVDEANDDDVDPNHDGNDGHGAAPPSTPITPSPAKPKPASQKSPVVTPTSGAAKPIPTSGSPKPIVSLLPPPAATAPKAKTSNGKTVVNNASK